jgi:hypothetical protein
MGIAADTFISVWRGTAWKLKLWGRGIRQLLSTSNGPVSITESLILQVVRAAAGGGKYIPFGQPGGTIDPAFNIEDFVYQGAFKYQLSDAVSGTGYNRGAFGYRAPDGSNGVNGSFFADSIYGNAIAEFQIPASFSAATDRASLQSATAMQGFVNLDPKTTIAESEPNDAIGWMHMIDGRLWVSRHFLYGGSSARPMVVFDNPADLAASTAYGHFGMEGGGLTLNYCSELPAEWQATFNATHLVGNCYGMSIASRSSQGPSLFTFDKAAYTGSQATIPTVMQIGWPYLTVGGRAMGDTLYPAPAGESFADNDWDSYNEGTSLHYYRDTLGFATYDQWRVSSPRTEWSTLTLPPESLRNDLNSLINGGWIGFVVPGTDTFLVLGAQLGNEFGNGYKKDNFQGTLPNNGGGAPFDVNDQDNYYWAFNLNDIAGIADIYDLLPFEYGRFDNNRWFNTGGNIKTVGDKVGGGHFDPTNNRLYVSIASGNESPNIVSVYQLGGV